jgi:uncharacterized protein (DUF2126 family)
MSHWSVVEDNKKAKIFPTKKEAMKYFMNRKKKPHTLMALLHYKNGKWVGAKQN